VTIEDLSGIVEVLVFPKIFKEDQEKWNDGKVLQIEGTISTKDNMVKILVNKAKEINLSEAENIKDDEVNEKKQDTFLEIKVPGHTKKYKLVNLKELLVENEGEGELYLLVFVQGKAKRIKSKMKVAISADLKNQIHGILYDSNS